MHLNRVWVECVSPGRGFLDKPHYGRLSLSFISCDRDEFPWYQHCPTSWQPSSDVDLDTCFSTKATLTLPLRQRNCSKPEWGLSTDHAVWGTGKLESSVCQSHLFCHSTPYTAGKALWRDTVNSRFQAQRVWKTQQHLCSIHSRIIIFSSWFTQVLVYWHSFSTT